MGATVCYVSNPPRSFPLHAFQGLAIENLTAQIALIINMYVNSIALGSIRHHYYIVFLALNLVWLAIMSMIFPETKGYALEELAMLFDDEETVLQG